jgi:DNA helicase II / ATP-dependent DNA helicase PcrA
MQSNFLEELKNQKYPPSDSQLEAIINTEGPLLIIAGPGAGKTKTLVDRIVHLISKGSKPEEIMVATFTEKAAKELITRVSNRLLELDIKINLNEMYIGTLHSIFLRFLEEYREFTRLKRSYRLLDQFDQRYFIYRNIKDYLAVEDADDLLGDFKTPRWTKADKLIGYINTVGEENLDIEVLKKSDDHGVRAIGEFYEIYSKQVEEDNSLDFSFIQTEAYNLINNSPKVLEEIQEKIKYLMVDEYQDTNTIQEKIILLLASKNNNLCVVGDDDQGLYRFRGATIRNILEFADNFEKGLCKQVTLTTNYRSHPEIIDFYNRWMAEMEWSKDGRKFRYDKVIQPRDGKFINIPSVIKVSNDSSLEDYYKEVYHFIIDLEKKDVLTDRNQIAFLFKSVKNEKVIGLAEYLESKGIQIFSPRSSLFFKRDEVQLLLGAIVFVFPDLFETLKWSDTANLSIWDYYQTCKLKFANAIRENPEENKALLQWCQTRAKEHLTLTEGTNYGFAALVYQLLEYPLFSKYLTVGLDANKTDLRASYNIALFTKLLWKYEYLNNVTIITPDNKEKLLTNLFNQFLRFIYEGGIEEYEDFDEYAPSGCVSFMTIHQSKGLEFPIVVTGMPNSRQGPRTQYSETDAILQEKYYHKPPFEPLEETKNYDFWRLFYTAFSRPQNLLVLSCQEQKTKKETWSSPNKLFKNLYEDTLSWKNPSFDASKLELETIKPVNIKHEYSFTSHILLYENCPQQYKFYKELEFTEVRTGGVLGGQLLHQTIEDIHKAVLKGDRDKLTNDNIEGWFNTNYHLLTKQMRSYLHKPQQLALLRQILNYRDKNNGQWDKIVEAEVDVSLVKESYILKGTIDLIKGEDGTVELVDFKSGDKPDVNATDELTRNTLDRYRRQLEVYAHLVEERTGHKVSKMHLHYPKVESANPNITFNMNENTISKTIETFDKVVENIEKKNFDNTHITRNEKQCGDCDMRYYCNPKQY